MKPIMHEKVRKDFKSFTLLLASFLLLLLAACSTEQPNNLPTTEDLPAVINADAHNAIPGQYIVVFKTDNLAAQGLNANEPHIQPVEMNSLSTQAMSAFQSEDSEAFEKELLASLNLNRGLNTQALNENDVNVQFVYAYAVGGFAAHLSDIALEAIRANPDVAYVEADATEQLDDVNVTEDDVSIEESEVGFETQGVWHYPWGIIRIDQRDLPLGSDLGHLDSRNAFNVHFYIIDSGIYAAHNAFDRVGGVKSMVQGGYTAVGDGRGTQDCNGHGTHVAATVKSNGYGVLYALNGNIHPVRVLDCRGKGSTSNTIAGVNWVTKNRIKPAVANVSLGSTTLSPTKEQAVRNSIATGVTYVIAAGNNNIDACKFSPANVKEAITVGYTNSSDRRGQYSNYGSCVDIFAPGENVRSAGISSSSAEATKTGTSMAAPHVAGIVGAYLDSVVKPNATPAQVWQAVSSGATTNRLSNIGTGSPNKLAYLFAKNN